MKKITDKERMKAPFGVVSKIFQIPTPQLRHCDFVELLPGFEEMKKAVWEGLEPGAAVYMAITPEQYDELQLSQRAIYRVADLMRRFIQENKLKTNKDGELHVMTYTDRTKKKVCVVSDTPLPGMENKMYGAGGGVGKTRSRKKPSL